MAQPEDPLARKAINFTGHTWSTINHVWHGDPKRVSRIRLSLDGDDGHHRLDFCPETIAQITQHAAVILSQEHMRLWIAKELNIKYPQTTVYAPNFRGATFDGSGNIVFIKSLLRAL